MKRIKLTQNQYALVDDADYEELSKYKWFALKHCSGDLCAARNSPRINSKHHHIRMHRQILGLDYGDPRQGDHRNHNTLDNQRVNLRICTPQQNQRNRISFSNSTSSFKGVCWDKSRKKWMAAIVVNRKNKYLGRFKDEKTAAEAYDKAATQEFGEFACLNFPLTRTEIMIQ